MSVTYIPLEVRQHVARRAQYRCEYCHTQEAIVGMPLEIEHVVPQIAGGSSDEANLCLACPRCNRYKGPQTHALDAETAHAVALFHPRQQLWEEHFAWQHNGLYLLGLTPTGRATIAALRLNNPFIVRAQQVWVEAGWHPPRDA